mmetsp:Transcript_6592/g.16802  ORF Transcript_6592/g.16802 Transcript_6592/m.16802 type:complete len:264 (+) Transcript_6592:187-978(+)
MSKPSADDHSARAHTPLLLRMRAEKALRKQGERKKARKQGKSSAHLLFERDDLDFFDFFEDPIGMKKSAAMPPSTITRAAMSGSSTANMAKRPPTTPASMRRELMLRVKSDARSLNTKLTTRVVTAQAVPSAPLPPLVPPAWRPRRPLSDPLSLPLLLRSLSLSLLLSLSLSLSLRPLPLLLATPLFMRCAARTAARPGWLAARFAAGLLDAERPFLFAAPSSLSLSLLLSLADSFPPARGLTLCRLALVLRCRLSRRSRSSS